MDYSKQKIKSKPSFPSSSSTLPTVTRVHYTTTFVLPTRDVYPVSHYQIHTALAQFLMASLTFTNTLHTIHVSINNIDQYTIQKEIRSMEHPNNTGMHIPLPSSIMQTPTNVRTHSVSSVWSKTSAMSSLLFNYNSSTTTNTMLKSATNDSTNPKSTTTTVPQHLHAHQLSTDLFTIQDTIQERIVQYTVTVYHNNNNPHSTLTLRSNDGSTTATNDTASPSAMSSSSSYSVYTKLISCLVTTHIPTEMVTKMERITKKLPPSTLPIQLFLPHYYQDHQTNGNRSSSIHATASSSSSSSSSTTIYDKMAKRIATSILPKTGTNNNASSNHSSGRIYIGFKTSQTTGLHGIHISAPFIPTVEREAMDLVDPILYQYNSQLLYCSGLLLRYVLEYTMFSTIHTPYMKNVKQYQKQNEQLLHDYYNCSNSSDSNSHPLDTVNGNHNDEFGEVNVEEEEDVDEEIEKFLNGGHDATTSKKTSSTTTTSSTTNTTLFGLAKYMAKGMTKQIATVAKSMNDGMTIGLNGMSNNMNSSNDTASLLYPPDLRALSREEKQAIVLMKAYCPIQPSTPDVTVGTMIAQGFVNGLAAHVLPPVLCIDNGVISSSSSSTTNTNTTMAKLPYYGIERFVTHNVVRSKMYRTVESYHTIVAQCAPLQYEDLYRYIHGNVMEQKLMILLLQWWTKFCQVEMSRPSEKSMIQMRGVQLKDVIRYYPCTNGAAPSTSTKSAIHLSQYHYYLDRNSPFQTLYPHIPLPETVLPRSIQEAITLNVLTHETIHDIWFSSMPIEIFAEYISRQNCMNLGKPEDDIIRIQVLTILCREYMRRSNSDRAVFGGLCNSLLSKRRCLPFDSDVPTQYTADFPTDLYLNNAELQAFAAIGSFHKVSNTLQQHSDMTEEFLVVLGVRKSVSIDFLFTHLDQLCWDSNPKPLIEYLQTNAATLSNTDWEKLATSKYLPAANDPASNSTYAPFELYLPDDRLRTLPFVKMLAWPESSSITEKSNTGLFLRRLGMKVAPTLVQVLSYLTQNDTSEENHLNALDYLCDRLVPHGLYYSQYTNMSYNDKKKYRVVPCIVHDPITSPLNATSTAAQQRQSPVMCFSDMSCAIMGFPVIDPKLGKKGTIYGSLLQCETEPPASYLLNQLKHLVALAKDRIKIADQKEHGSTIVSTFQQLFKYLSQRSAELNYNSLEALGREAFIPCMNNEKLVWYRPSDVFFRRAASKTIDNHGGSDTLTEELFHVIDFNPFLAAAGVKEEATTADLFQRLLSSPQDVLNTLGSEKKYRSLLRRVAADPPFPISRPPANVKNAPFLLAYRVKSYSDANTEGSVSDKLTHQLAKADDIYVIDNSNYGRMFTVNRAPPESDLEDFYIRLGAHYISKSVERRFEVMGSPKSDTTLTNALRERLCERGPLLVSPNITSRPLVSDAGSILNDKRLEFFEAPNLLAVYTLGKVSRRSSTTCFSRPNRQKNLIYITPDFDLFDVGQAIGDLILKRCMLEDAFFISSLLDTPLEQLRARGFPVDRVVKSEPVVPVEPEKPMKQQKPIQQAPTIATIPERSKVAAVGRLSPEVASVPQVSNSSEQSGLVNAHIETPTSTTIDDDRKPPASLTGSKADILLQMFPDADPSFVQAALGTNPTVDDVKELADTMSNGHYPKTKSSQGDTANASDNTDDSTIATSSDSLNLSDAAMKKKSLRQRLGGAFSSKRRTTSNEGTTVPPTFLGNGIPNIGSGGSNATTAHPPSGSGTNTMNEQRTPVSPAEDARTQTALEQMLQRSVHTSNRVTRQDIDAPETTLTSIPPDLDRGDTCEVIPGHSLQPYTLKKPSGIQVFSSKEFPSSATFLVDNDVSLQCFGIILERLCVGVFALPLASIAIYHDPAGVSIAFNRNRALHFNFRFFHGLHYLTGKYNTSECYAYWFVTTCHELAHHLVSGHTKEHGFYCENFNQLYLPKLILMLQTHRIPVA